MIRFTINSFSNGLQAARTIPLKTLYKTVVAIPFGVMKKINLRLVLGTERKKILKDITNVISVKL